MDNAGKAPVEPPLFVVGCGRSGSTLLRLMLDAHSQLSIPGESHFIPRLARRFGEGTVPTKEVSEAVLRTPHLSHWKIPEGSVRDRVATLGRSAPLASVLDAVYMANAEHHGKSRWGDKTPAYVRSIPLLSRLWPEARFVHLIRDGRDVCLSYLSVHWGPSNVWEAARKWRRDVAAGIRDGEPLGESRYLEVRYEDLIADAGPVLERICDFHGLGFEERMLDVSARIDHPTLSPAEGRPSHSRSEEPIRSGVRDWRTQMSNHDQRVFEAIAGGWLEELGYERSHSSASIPMRLEAIARIGWMRARELGSEPKKALMGRTGP